jgi:hypothetical protein
MSFIISRSRPNSLLVRSRKKGTRKNEHSKCHLKKLHTIMRQRKTLKEGYTPYLHRMMAYINNPPGGEYPRMIEWYQEQLLAIVPDAIASYFKQLAYGTSMPGPNDMPTHCRSTNLKQYKKAISFYIPNKISAWDIRSASGNPTKLVPVNDFVNTVRKMECRNQGRPSCAKRDMKRVKLGNYELQVKVPAMLKFQFHIIARTDNITNLDTGNLRSHNILGAFALQTKVSWSKNVMEEQSCPDQILLGAADTYFCILLALACYLESRISNNHHGRHLFGDRDDDMEPDPANSRYCNTLHDCWAEPECVALLAKIKGFLGPHSNQKFPSTWCAENGCTDADVEVMGRWMGADGRAVVTYISVEQLTTDAKLAGVLAVGGPIRYKLKDDSHISLQFLKSTVAPTMHDHFGADPSNSIADVLSLPLL